MKPAKIGTYVVDERVYQGTRAQREGARHALSWASGRNERPECELLVAAPADGNTIINEQYSTAFLDLRTTIRSMIADCTSHVLLAAPYWDPQVAGELTELLRRRQEAGVTVHILCRQPTPGSQNEQALAVIRQTLPARAYEVRALESPSSADPFGTSTFHFKAACVDDANVYIGSANFNTAGLNSRWELGVRLTGQQALNVAQLLHGLWSRARPL